MNNYVSTHNLHVLIYCLQANGTIGDLHDGSVIADLMQPGQFLSVPRYTGLILNTDGVPMFKSSKINPLANLLGHNQFASYYQDEFRCLVWSE